MLKKSEVLQDLKSSVCWIAKVNLKLWVKVQKNWRDSDYMMKNFGYREDEM